ncbi:DEAD/DEAH box helicase, partial [Klebsiella pneumoniae]|nr:DEAD/DEAH box helicase [Klebsiella pneumoniae]
RREANKNLHLQLSRRGFRLSHSFTTVLYSRLLRAGSGDGTDDQLHQMLTEWTSLEAQSGVEFTLNTMAHALAVKAQGADSEAAVIFGLQCR